MLIQADYKDIPNLRKKLLEKQNYICPITKVPLTNENSAVDHKHKFFKNETVGINPDEYGIIRGAIQFQVNMLEGKISNSYVRLGLHKIAPLPDILRNLADYLEKIPYSEEINNEPVYYIHPSEKPKERKITRTCYAKLLKVLRAENFKNKIPEYPKSQILTKALSELFTKYNVEVEYYK